MLFDTDCYLAQCYLMISLKRNGCAYSYVQNHKYDSWSM